MLFSVETKKVIKNIVFKSYQRSFRSACYYHVTCEFQSESTLYSLPECQETPCSKQAPYLKFK